MKFQNEVIKWKVGYNVEGAESSKYVSFLKSRKTWWRHQMETISALLALCEGNPPPTVTGQWRGLDIFIDLRLNKRLGKQSKCRRKRRCFETQSRSLWRHSNVRSQKAPYIVSSRVDCEVKFLTTLYLSRYCYLNYLFLLNRVITSLSRNHVVITRLMPNARMRSEKCDMFVSKYLLNRRSS